MSKTVYVIELHSMLKRRFAVIKLWPELKTAEDECIARLKASARAVGVECLEVDSFARLVEPPHTQLTKDDVDFILSLHYETPKRYDIFSFVALWNPLDFYYIWGYRRFTQHLLTHDDFLSCSSDSADDHVRRIIGEDPLRDGPVLQLFHSLSEPLLPPTTGSNTLMYTGINWERVQNMPSRHDPLLRMLDSTGDLRIFGPKIFHGVRVWEGFKSYVGPLPFDGVSIVGEIHKAGISLVLSSDAHKAAGLMSSRLFESLAAGAVIICDENPWAKRFFGETLLYIDTSVTPEETFEQIQNHVQWVKREPEKAIALAAEAQEIFRRDFRMDLCLERIYEELPKRRATLEALAGPKVSEKISLILLMPEFHNEVLKQHVASCEAQSNVDVDCILVVNRRDAELFGERLQNELRRAKTSIRLEIADYYTPSGRQDRNRQRRNLGLVISEILKDVTHEDLVCLAAPNEQLFSNHLSSLLGALQAYQESSGAASDVLLAHHSNKEDHADLCTNLDFTTFVSNMPVGLGRFLLRTSKHPPGLQTVLPYLDMLAPYALAGTLRLARTRRNTVRMDIENRFHLEQMSEKVPKEREILIDYAPSVFSSRGSDNLRPVKIDLDRMESADKTKLAVELAHSVPMPKFFKKIVFGLYRTWLWRFYK